jgi:hypothetical protein
MPHQPGHRHAQLQTRTDRGDRAAPRGDRDRPQRRERVRHQRERRRGRAIHDPPHHRKDHTDDARHSPNGKRLARPRDHTRAHVVRQRAPHSSASINRHRPAPRRDQPLPAPKQEPTARGAASQIATSEMREQHLCNSPGPIIGRTAATPCASIGSLQRSPIGSWLLCDGGSQVDPVKSDCRLAIAERPR